MKSFSASFTAEKNKRGTAPVNLLKFNFDTPVYISDRDITPTGGEFHQGLVHTWGFVDSAVQQTPGAGVLGAIATSDLTLTIINSTAPRFSDNFDPEDPPENVTVEMYQYFEGIPAADADLLFKGVVDEITYYDERLCSLVVRGIWSKYNIRIGEDKIINTDDFPAADPDDIGKMQNIVYGSVEKLPCRAIQSGAVDNLVDEISATATVIQLSDTSEFASSGVIRCDNEEIAYNSKSGNILWSYSSGRGYNGTTAVIHNEGAAVWQVLTEFVYQVAGHPVKAIGHCYVDNVRITSIVTKYTGQAVSQLAGYEDFAVFTVPRRLTRQQAIDVLISDGTEINDAIEILDSIDVDDGITVSDTLALSDTIDVSDTIAVDDTISVSDTIGVSEGSHRHGTYAYMALFSEGLHSYSGVGQPHEVVGNNLASDNYAYFFNPSTWSKYIFVTVKAPGGTPNQARIGMHYRFVNGPMTVRLRFFDSGGNLITTLYTGTSAAQAAVISSWTNVVGKTWNNISGGYFYLDVTSGGGSGDQVNVYDVWLEVQYVTNASGASGIAKTGGASKTGAADKTGSATKSGEVTMGGSVSKDGAVSKTGEVTKSGEVTRTGVITLTGNSVADVTIGQLITANVDGYQDDASGTYTGTPDALIERPDHVFRHAWCTLLGGPAADIDTAAFAAAGSFFATRGYAFAFAVTAPVQAESLLTTLAMQCRSRFFVTPAGEARLMVRQLGQASVHSVVSTPTSSEIKQGSVRIRRSPTEELFNDFTLFYNRNWAVAGLAGSAFLSNRHFSDALSKARYGTRTPRIPENTFYFFAVTDDDMALDVGNFLLSYHAYIRQMQEFAVFLDNMEIEVGDIIDITHPLDNMTAVVCEVLKLVHVPGSAKSNTIDHIKITTINNEE